MSRSSIAEQAYTIAKALTLNLVPYQDNHNQIDPEMQELITGLLLLSRNAPEKTGATDIHDNNYSDFIEDRYLFKSK